MLFRGACIVGRRDHRAAGATILIGIVDTPGLKDGRLSLNHKREADEVESATDYISRQSEETIRAWKTALGIGLKPEVPLDGTTIVVEDASVDTCLAIISLLRRLDGQTLPEEWVAYSRLWEQGYTETTGAPETSLGALLSSLVHVELQQGVGAPPEQESEVFGSAIATGVAYIEGLLEQGCSPFDVPKHLPVVPRALRTLHQQAHSRLNYERLTYQRLSNAAIRLQLAIHLDGSNRKALVDTILFSEAMLTGTLKSFARAETNTFTGQGYAFMGLYRPALAGTGNDITLSTKPSADLSLKSLWLELERMEDEKWAEFEMTADGFPRPRGGGKDRRLDSHGLENFEGTPSHQPWWDDGGKHTLIAAPRGIEHDGVFQPGTRLTWSDVKQAIWNCYAPTMGLRVHLREQASEGLKLSENTKEVAALRKPLVFGSGLYLINIVRAGRGEDDVVIWSPTLSAIIASLLARGRSDIDDLPAPDTFDVIEARGGIVIVTEEGVTLLEMSRSGEFPADELKRAASEVAMTVASASTLETEIREKIRGLVVGAVDQEDAANKRESLKAIYAAKLRARESWESATRHETNDLVRRFRELCERRWQAKAKYDNAMAEISELEDMVLTTSEVRANTILNRLAIYGLPASLAGNLLGGALVLGNQGEYETFSWAVLIVYLAVSVAGMFLLRLVSKRETDRWRITGRNPE